MSRTIEELRTAIETAVQKHGFVEPQETIVKPPASSPTRRVSKLVDLLRQGRIWLTREAIAIALVRPAPDRIPMVGAKARLRNYSTVATANGDDWFHLSHLTSRGARAFTFKRDSQEAAKDVCVLNWSFGDCTLRITQYHAELEIKYDSAAEFLLHHALGYRHFLLAKDRLGQLLFNRRRLVRRDRIVMLRAIAEATLARQNAAFSSVGIMAELYGVRWPLHPQGDSIEAYCEQVLQSLAASGDLATKDGHSFGLAPGGLRTLADYELEERRHAQMRSRQTVTIFVTIVLAVLTAAQVYQTWEGTRQLVTSPD